MTHSMMIDSGAAGSRRSASSPLAARPSSLEGPSSQGCEDGQTGPGNGTDQPMSEDRPDREMVQTSLRARTDQPTKWDGPAYEMGWTCLSADPQ